MEKQTNDCDKVSNDLQRPSETHLTFAVGTDEYDSMKVIDPTEKLPGLVTKRNAEYLGMGGAEKFAARLSSDRMFGLRSTNVIANRIRFGENRYEKRWLQSFLTCLAVALKNTNVVTVVLLACAVLSIAFGVKQHGPRIGWINGVSAICAIIFIVFFSAFTRFWLWRESIKSLYLSNDFDVKVVRDGRLITISKYDVVVGELVLLSGGDSVPADGLLWDGCSMIVDVSTVLSMNGKSSSSRKNHTHNHLFLTIDEKRPFLLSGSTVTGGYGYMLVVDVGMNTIRGKELSSSFCVSNVLDKEPITPMQAALSNINSIILRIGMAFAVFILTLLIIRHFTLQATTVEIHEIEAAVIDFFGGAVAIFSCVIPAGYDGIFYLTLACSVRRMRRSAGSILVRELSAFETMATSTVILLTEATFLENSKEEVQRTVESCKQAGVGIKMITECGMDKARKIVSVFGITLGSSSSEGFIEAERFFNCSLEESMEMINNGNISVVTDCSSSQKAQVVRYLKQKNHVVAVIGNGGEDVAALQEANVGIFIGKRQGSVSANRNSDIVISRDEFSFIVEALKGGRSLRYNIQRFLQFQVTIYLSAVFTTILSAAYSGETPLAVFQILWERFMISTLPTLALATDSHSPLVPSDTDHHTSAAPVLISKVMWRNILGLAWYQATIFMAFHYMDCPIFNTFVLSQVFNLLNARVIEGRNIFRGIHKNRFFLFIIVLIIVMQVVVMEFLDRVAITRKPDWTNWCSSLATAAFSLVFVCFFKLIPPNYLPCP